MILGPGRAWCTAQKPCRAATRHVSCWGLAMAADAMPMPFSANSWARLIPLDVTNPTPAPLVAELRPLELKLGRMARGAGSCRASIVVADAARPNRVGLQRTGSKY